MWQSLEEFSQEHFGYEPNQSMRDQVGREGICECGHLNLSRHDLTNGCIGDSLGPCACRLALDERVALFKEA